METDAEQYTPVYHFCDDRLFELFLEKIPRARLVEHLRKSESLRNRLFPGFRVSNSSPTDRQLFTAYKREITERHNSSLATFLCASWIKQQPAKG
jgi:hypothetical protein